MRVAVVGHVEWVEFAVVERVPASGEIVHAREVFSEAAGGGGVAAVQLAKLAGGADFFTALGDDEPGRRSAQRFAAEGVELHSAAAPATRRAFTFLSADHERTIAVLGERVVPRGADPLPWDRLDGCDAVYFTGGDAEALRQARRARFLVATPRASETLIEAKVPLDVLVASAGDSGERVPPLDPLPRWIVLTRGGAGGEWTGQEGRTGRWAAADLPGEPVDAYGCGDAFAAGLTFGLAESGGDLEHALALAARCGAHALCGRGPYAGQLTRRSAA